MLRSLVVLLSVGCGGEMDTCTVEDRGDGTYTMSCPDGTSTTWTDGKDGQAVVLSEGEGILEGSIEVQNIVDVHFLQSFHTINGNLTVSMSDANLSSITTVNGITTISGFNNVNLTNLNYTSELIVIGSEITNINLTELSNVNKNMVIINTELTNLDNIGNNLNIMNKLHIGFNQSLSTCIIEEWLNSVTVNGEIVIEDNAGC